MPIPRAASWMTVVLATLLLSGCASAPTPSGMPSPDISPPTPTLTAAPAAAAKIPFDGDCGQVVTEPVLGGVFDGKEPTASSPTLISVMPDVIATSALLGGLPCSWSTTGANIAWAGVHILPVDLVPEAVLDSTAEFACPGWTGCGRGEVQGGMWVWAAVAPSSSPGAATAEEFEMLGATVDALLSHVAARPAGDRLGVAVQPGDGWWTIPSCDALEGAVVSSTQMVDPQAGYPSDVYPEGALWDIVVANGVDQWCAWYSYEGENVVLAEIDIQPGIGAPSTSMLDRVGAQPITIPGADAAYLINDGQGISTRSQKVLAIAGANRVTVGGDHPEAVAAAVLAELAAP